MFQIKKLSRLLCEFPVPHGFGKVFLYPSSKKRILIDLPTHDRSWTMTRQNGRFFRQGEDFRADRMDQSFVIAPGKVCSTDTAEK